MRRHGGVLEKWCLRLSSSQARDHASKYWPMSILDCIYFDRFRVLTFNFGIPTTFSHVVG